MNAFPELRDQLPPKNEQPTPEGLYVAVWKFLNRSFHKSGKETNSIADIKSSTGYQTAKNLRVRNVLHGCKFRRGSRRLV